MKELAKVKLKSEAEKIKGQQERIVAEPVRAALAEFCEQDAEFAQAVYQGGSFADCLKAVLKGVGNALSDLDAYRRAVQFYFPGADISFQMSVNLLVPPQR